MNREDTYTFIETVKQIREGGGALSQYFDREIADAIQTLIDSAVRQEREQCAALVDAMAEAAGPLMRGQRSRLKKSKRESA